MTRDEYESQLKSFIGQRISKVLYFNLYVDPADIIDSDGDSTYDWRNKSFHTLDYGIELHTSSGRILGLIWGDQFAQYGLDLYTKSLITQFVPPGAKTQDVSKIPEWKDIIGKQIIAISACWSWRAINIEPGTSYNDIPDDKKIDYPKDIQIEFETGHSYYISASTYIPPGDMLFGGSDEVTVIFDEDVARKYSVGCKSENTEATSDK